MQQSESLQVHPRIHERHPAISEKDVICAWSFPLVSAIRSGAAYDDLVVVGGDGQGRLLELVAVREEDSWLIYHANTPPTKRVLKELGLNLGGRHGA